MIKVEVVEGEEDKTLLFFEASKPEDQAAMDRLLELLTGPHDKRGGFVLGAPNLTLRIEARLAK